MPRPAPSTFATVRAEGGLLPPDLLARIAANDTTLKGLEPADYGLVKGERLNGATSRAWVNARVYWAAFRAATASLGPGERGVTETRELWLLPLFRELGHGRLVYRQTAEEIAGRRYAVSHQAGDGLAAPPIHTLSYRDPIDKPGPQTDGAGAAALRVSPHGLMQEYLNQSDHLWGIVGNGLRLRLLRDNASLSRAAFVEFDLEAMMEGGVYADFVLLYLLLHRSRLPSPGSPPETCRLERWREAAEEQGTRALDELRAGVETAIRALGQGLLEHPANEGLRARLVAGDLPVAGYYRQLLRLVYRLLFLLAAEDRALLFEEGADPRKREVYRRHYGVARLRELVEQRRHADRHDDLWRSLEIVFAALRDKASGAALGLKPLAGGLFGPGSCPDLDGLHLANHRLLDAVRGLTWFTGRGDRLARRVNYRDMDVEELGSVYEGLLELQPVLRTAGDHPAFDLGASGERKLTGSYYTNRGLVHELIVSALDPVIVDALARGRTIDEKKANLLALKVCDPACGSGHFLLAAARRIGREWARLDASETEPDPAAVRRGVREAIAHCVHGVDLNPLAVDLCKLALWLEGHDPGRPLEFLDHHVKLGNSLVGVFDLEQLLGEIPDGAYQPVTGDDRSMAALVKRLNRGQRDTGQRPLDRVPSTPLGDPSERLAKAARALDELPGRTLDDLRAKETRYEELHGEGSDSWTARKPRDLWTAAFFAPLVREPGGARDVLVPTSDDVRLAREQPKSLHGQVIGQAEALRQRLGFFHWSIEFANVFPPGEAKGGFDCVLGNPPWERIKLQEQEFFAARDPEIVAAPNAAARCRLIATLAERDPNLARAFEDAKHDAEATSKFLRQSGRFPQTGRGDVNTYSVFAELMARLLNPRGRAGIIVPTGIATDDTNKHFFRWLVDGGRLASLYDFENRDALFPGVHRSYKFSLLAVAGGERPAAPFEAAFFLTQPAQLREPDCRFALSTADIALLNPNTRTCPIFRSARDAEITKRLYEAAPVLLREGPPEANPWGVTFKTLFHMSNDSHLFRTRRELEEAGGRLGEDGRFRGGGETWLPLYEAKMVHQFDHRFATYDGPPEAERARDFTFAEHANPSRVPLPRYWVDEREVERAAGSNRRPHPGWFLGFRDITNGTNERTAIFSVVPWAGIGNSLPILDLHEPDAHLAATLIANASSFAFDFPTRQKAGGTHLNFFIVKQLPVIPPERYTPALLDQIVPRVLELTYTAWDLEPFAKDCGYAGPPFAWDEERRARLRAELDGIYAHLYRLNRDDFAYVLDTFPIVARKDRAAFGEERTKRLCLEAYDRFATELRPSPARVIVEVPSVLVPQPELPRPLPVAAEERAAYVAAKPTLAPPDTAGVARPSPRQRAAALERRPTTGSDRYRQAAVAAWLAAEGRGDPNFGRTKLVKELYFLQHHLGADLNLEFVREAAGPLDPAVYKVENLAQGQGWLRVLGKRGERATYLPGPAAPKAAEVARVALGNLLPEAEALLAQFRPFDTLKMEQWATVHQVWDERRMQGKPPTYAGVVSGVLSWKEGKRGFDERSLARVIDEMTRAGMIALEP